MKFNLKKTIVITLGIVMLIGCNGVEKNEMEKKFEEFIKTYEQKVIPLTKEINLASYNASISGKSEEYQKTADLQIELSKIYSNKDDFAKLVEFKNSGEIKDELLKRQLTIIYNGYASYQLDEKLLEQIIKLSTQIEEKFNTFRVVLKSKKVTDNEIEEILQTSRDSKEVETAWTASKEIGALVEKDIKDLVKMRNDAAQKLGYKNYHEMSLSLSEQNIEEIDKLFDELDELTRDEYIKLKDEIDEYLAKKFNIKKEDLMPWHYQDRFFQEGPAIYDVDLDEYYKDKDIAQITKEYYDGIGLPIDDLLEKSDLYEKEGKYQHAFCTHIDREGDVRVLCNIKPNYRWMGTMLHEFGHAVYDKFISKELPWTLRNPAHTFTTEAIAMLFGRMAASPQWMKDVLKISEEEKNKIAEACFKSLKLQQLIFSRWSQVMYRFEKEMYSNPEQDLNKLWWDLVEKYQMVKKPKGRNAPDWAAKIHIALYPAYYHNYLMGELLSSQIYFYILENILEVKEYDDYSFNNVQEVGEYLRSQIFEPGQKYYWNDLIEKATGEKLTAKYYARQFVGKK